MTSAPEHDDLNRHATYTIWADYHQVILAGPDGALFGGEIGPLLVAPTRSSLIIRTGCASGPVRVTCVGAVPEPLGNTVPKDWEICEEVSMKVEGDLWLTPIMAGPDPLMTPVRVFTGLSGTYRVRVSARGRGLNYDGYPEEPQEDYLVQAWYDEPARARIVVGGDAASASMST